MREQRLTYIVIVALAVACASAGPRADYREQKGRLEFTGQLIVRPKEGKSSAAQHTMTLAPSRRSLVNTGEWVLQVPKGQTVNSFANQLLATGNFSYVEPNWLCFPASIPNDPQILQQWHLFQISAPQAWDDNSGAGVIVAVTDSGVDLSHPDLQNRVSGYNAVSNLTEQMGGVVSDVHVTGHGTQVSGVLCATGNNGVGVAGVAYGATLMPIRVSNASSGAATLADLKEGIEWAATHGAKVINTSYTGVNHATVQATGAFCRLQGAISVWAVGNDGLNTDAMTYQGAPAAKWDHADVIVVGATDNSDGLATFSNFGRAVDFLAPGTGIITTEKGGGYTASNTTRAGTSYAAPIVAGCLAISIATNPAFSIDRHIRRLELGSYDIGKRPGPGEQGYSLTTYRPGNDLVNGWGRVNVGSAIHPSFPLYRLTTIPLISGAVSSNVSGINDRGDAVGWCTFPGGATMPFMYSEGTLTSLPRLNSLWSGTPDLATIAVDINDARQVLLDGYDRAGRWSQATGIENLDVQAPWAHPSTVLNAKRINNYGNAIADVGFNYGNSGYLEQVWLGTEPLSLNFEFDRNPISEKALDINDQNRFTSYRYSPNLISRVYDISFEDELWIARQTYITASDHIIRGLCNSGFAVGYQNSGGVVRAAMFWPDGRSIVWPTSLGQMDLYEANESEVAVGTTLGSPVAFIHYGHEGAFTLVSRVFSMGNWISLSQGTKINSNGMIIGDGVRIGSSNSRSFIARPEVGVSIAVDLGTLASNPIYLGAIPPAFVVIQYLQPDGTPFDDARRIYSYRPNDGLLNVNGAGEAVPIVLPPSVTGNFRVLVRLTNSSNIDWFDGEWEGAGYLGRIYPAMDTPPLPIDTATIPMVELPMGDIDCDNEIAIGDYAILSSAYGQPFTSSADIDGDGEVSIGDYAILSGNYGLVGD